MHKAVQQHTNTKPHMDQWVLMTHHSTLERSTHGSNKYARPSHMHLQVHLQDPLLDMHLTSHAIYSQSSHPVHAQQDQDL